MSNAIDQAGRWPSQEAPAHDDVRTGDDGKEESDERSAD